MNNQVRVIRGIVRRCRRYTKAFYKRATLAAFLLLLAASRVYGGTLDPAVIGIFPKDAGGLGYADLEQARQLPWYPQFEAQVVPVGLFEFERFLEVAQMSQTSPINQVAWSLVGADRNDPAQADATPTNGQQVGVACGDFDVGTIKSYLDVKQFTSIQLGRYSLYSSAAALAFRSIFFTILDSHTIAFGPLEQLKRVLNVREGEEDSLFQNESMMALIENANGGNVFWGVLNPAGAAAAIDQLVPEAVKFPQYRDLSGKLRKVLVTVHASDNMELTLQAETPSSADALLLSELLQAGVLMRRYKADGANNPEMVDLLNGVRIGANGNRVGISVELTNDQIIHLIEHNTFS